MAIVEHEVEFGSGKKPTKLYLGRAEFEELRAFAWDSGYSIMTRDVTGDRRTEYRGLKVYGVDDKNYLAVGI